MAPSEERRHDSELRQMIDTLDAQNLSTIDRAQLRMMRLVDEFMRYEFPAWQTEIRNSIQAVDGRLARHAKKNEDDRASDSADIRELLDLWRNARGALVIARWFVASWKGIAVAIAAIGGAVAAIKTYWR